MAAKDKPVQRHAKTLDQYEPDPHHPGGVTIPKARKSGGSRGFDLNKPSIVYIDPVGDPREDPSAIVFDPSQVDLDELEAVVRTTEQAEDVYAHFAGRGTPAASAPAHGLHRRDIDGQYTTRRIDHFVDNDNSPSVLKQKYAPAQPVAPARPPQPVEPVEEAPTEGDEGMDRDTMAALNKLVGHLNQTNARMEILAREVAQTRAPQSPTARPAPIDDDDDDEDDDVPEARKAPRRVAPSEPPQGADKPVREVIFDIPNFGGLAAFYHRIIECAKFVVLIYDRRYTDGLMFVPKELGPDVTLAMRFDGRTCHVNSLGVAYSDGPFEHVLLFKQQERQAEADAEAAVGEMIADTENLFAPGT